MSKYMECVDCRSRWTEEDCTGCCLAPEGPTGFHKDAKDPVNNPAHYTQGGIECIDAMTAAFGEERVADFCIANAFKYLWRHMNKNGLEDIRKAEWYLRRYRMLRYGDEDVK